MYRIFTLEIDKCTTLLAKWCQRGGVHRYFLPEVFNNYIQKYICTGSKVFIRCISLKSLDHLTCIGGVYTSILFGRELSVTIFHIFRSGTNQFLSYFCRLNHFFEFCFETQYHTRDNEKFL